VVTTTAIAILALTVPKKAWGWMRVDPPRWWQAPLVAAMPLIVAPLIAAHDWPDRLGVFVGSALLGFALAFFPLNIAGRDSSLARSVWIGLGVGLVAMIFVGAFGSPRAVHAAAVTEPVPGAATIAWRYRPVLRLDSDERFLPLDIDRAVAAHHVDTCSFTLGHHCNEVEPGEPIDLEADYLTLRAPAFGKGDPPGGPSSAYYYHVVRHADPPRIFVDYWWYFAENPLPVGRKWFCGPGLRHQFDCFEHPADWEGITVVLAPCVRGQPGCHSSSNGWYAVSVVQYAQHRFAAGYRWSRLQELWAPYGPTDERPLVFVALNSHASYPVPCTKDCQQTKSSLSEGRHDGRVAWTNNGNDVCADACLQPLPVSAGGSPASWGAFPGPWGAQHCILFGVYCDVGTPPLSPAYQSRYADPTRNVKFP
jgi:hypothetical protein